MSSSRSIAAARQRRAGDVVQKQPTSVRQQMGGQQRPNPNQRTFQQQQQQSQSYGATSLPDFQGKKPKIEVGTAIGLVTLRLGRLEQFVQQISENGQFKKDLVPGGASALPDNSKIVDNSVFTSLISRIDALERNQPKSNVSDMEVKSIKDMVMNLNASLDRLSKEMNERFGDVEAALSDIESRIQFDPEESVVSAVLAVEDMEDAVEGISYEISADE